jgi:hypothetical protein
LFDANGNAILANDNWQQDSAQALEIARAGFQPAHPLESAAAVSLNPGRYTTVVRGGNGSTGVGLVEVFRLP